MLTCLGRNAEETFAKCSASSSGIDHIRSFDTQGLPCTIAGEVLDDWILRPEGLPPFRIDIFSRIAGLLNTAVDEAANQAQLLQIETRERIGVCLASHGEMTSLAEIAYLHRFRDTSGHWDLVRLEKDGGYPFQDFTTRRPDVAASLIAQRFQCKGPNFCIGSACAAGAQAVGEAYHLIQCGAADVMLAGGGDAPVDPFNFTGFLLLRTLSESYASPGQASRPFDRKRNGFVLSEGAAVVVLEDLDHARTRGVPILGEILGYGSTADAFRITDIHPRSEGAVQVMKLALADAGLRPSDVEYINAHGTATIKNDVAETQAVKELFGPRAAALPISSNKSMLGHALGAAGVIECILTLMGMERDTILPTINYEFPDPKCDLWYVPERRIKRKHRVALSNSFGFGGQNACLCLGTGND